MKLLKRAISFGIFVIFAAALCHAQVGMYSSVYEGTVTSSYLQAVGYAQTTNGYGTANYPTVQAGCVLYNPNDNQTGAPVGNDPNKAYTTCATTAIISGGWTEDSYHTIFYYTDDADGGYDDPFGVSAYANCNTVWANDPDDTGQSSYEYYGNGSDINVSENGDCLGQTTADSNFSAVVINISPESTVLESGETVDLSATASNTAGYNAPISFEILNSGAGSITNTGSGTATYSAPDNITAASTVTVQACTTLTTPSTCASASISLTPYTITSVSASPTVLFANGTSQSNLSAILGNEGDGGTDVSLKWTASAGTVTNDSDSLTAVYTAPASATFSNSNTASASITASINPSSPAISNATSVTLVQQVAIPSSLSTNLIAGSTTSVTITGTGFNAASGETSASITSPSWGTAQVQSISVSSNTSLTLSVYVPPNPTNTATQSLTVTITSGYGGLTGSSSASINVTPLVYTYAITATPASANLAYGGTQVFSPTITCKLANGQSCSVSQAATYVIASGVGTLSATSGTSTKFTNTYQSGSAGTAVITMCAEISSSTCANATVTQQATSVTLSPTSSNLTEGKSQAVAASVSGAGAATQLSWSVSPNAGTLASSTSTLTVNGSVATSSNTYTAPTPVASATSVTVTACALPGGTACGSVVYNLEPVTITVSPATAALYPSQTQQFTATVANGTSTSATWSLTGTKHGSISSSGLYTAPSTASGTVTDTVQACSVADSTKCATATVTVAPYATTTTVALSATKVAYNQPVNVTVSVAASGESNYPTGTVTLYLKGSGSPLSLGSMTLSSGAASYTETVSSSSGINPGSYNVYAVYSGDSANSASTSANVAVSIVNNTTTTLTASSYSVPSGSSDTLTVNVSPTSATGTVTIAATGPGGTANLGSITLSNGTGSLTLSSSGYPLGSYSITATYSGDSLDAASTSSPITVVIGSPTTTTFTFSPTTVTPGQTINGTCTVTKSSGTPTGTCTVTLNGSAFTSGTLVNGSVSFSANSSGFTAGSYTLQAVYGGDSTSAASSSATQTLVVQ